MIGLAVPEGDEELEQATVSLQAFDEVVQQDIEVPAGKTRTRRMLPVFQSLAETLIEHAVARVEAEGKSVSCTRGCAACCRHLIPVAPAEARALHELVAELPGPTREAVLASCADARRRLGEAGLLARLGDTTWNDDEEAYAALASAYLALDIACPFLDAESSCMIHPDRPIVCREYLVTSPASACASPAPGRVHPVPLPGQISRELAGLDAPRSKPAPWKPLVLALDWAATHPEPEPTRTGLQLVSDFFARAQKEPDRRARNKKKAQRRR